MEGLAPSPTHLDTVVESAVASSLPSASSSSAGSTSSWDRNEMGSTPTSDSETSPLSKGDRMSGGHRGSVDSSEDHAEASKIWSPLSGSIPLAPLAPITSRTYTPHMNTSGSPPHSVVSGSPPERTAASDSHSSSRSQNAQSSTSLGLNSLSPHVEPFNPGHMSKQYPQTAAYARLLQPSRSEHNASAAAVEKRASLHEAQLDPSVMGSFAGETGATGFEQGGVGTAQSSGAQSLHRDLQPSLSSAGNEEISTIFVVGFPDDLQEREFQNMFIFSPGFEAATLKVPAGSLRDREPAHLGRGGAVGSFIYDQDDETGASNAGRKQIIGFAKFRTRAEAIDARNVLSGRKVDAEKGSVLKAEMAKKNLHTKRGLANDAVSGVGNPTGNASLQSLPALLAGMLQTQQLPPGVLDTAVTSLLRQDHPDRDARTAGPAYDGFSPALPASSGAFSYATSPTSPQLPGAQRHATAAGVVQPHVLNARQEYANLRNEVNHRGEGGRARSPPSTGGLSLSVDDIHTPPFAKSLMQQLDSEDESILGRSTGGSVGFPYGNDVGGRRPHASSDPAMAAYYGSPVEEPQGGLRDRMSSLNLGQPLSAGLVSPGAMSPTFPRTQNPADQNPPINTLYVGGLPAVQPSLVGPMSAAHLEDCLRNAFSRCPGFRRLCFRQKSNGPMCFVEFEDVHLASRALSEMYGNTLNGLVKGGIRLSFSKNPLGVRNGSISSSNGPLSPTSSSAFLPPEPYSASLSTSPTPSSASGGGGTSGHPRRPSDASYYSIASASSGHRSLTPRGNMSPPAHASNAFSPFGYSASSTIEP